MSWSVIDLSILLPAFAAGVLVLATHVPLGAQVLRKGIVFIDLAIAQIAGLGVIVAGMLVAIIGEPGELVQHLKGIVGSGPAQHSVHRVAVG